MEDQMSESSHIVIDRVFYDKMLADIRKVITILQPLTSNRRFMQIANPARQVLNILKQYDPQSNTPTSSPVR